MALVFELGLGALAAGVAWLIGYPLLETVRPTLPGTALAVLATLPLLGALWGLLASGWQPIRRLVNELERHVLPLFARCTPLELAAIAAAAGIGEELLFRGLVQELLMRAAGVPLGLLVASALFGLAHFVTGTYAVLAGAVGLYLGALAVLSGGLWVPILVHALYDLVALVVWTQTRRGVPLPNRRRPAGDPS
jgi:membrane protease YdiL (CAAX protease family)